MKRILLASLCLLIAGSVSAQELVLGNHDVVRLGEYPQETYLLEADANNFYRISGGYATDSDHPLLGAALDINFRSVYFIKYDSKGVPLKSNFVRGTNIVTYAGSFKGGLTLMSRAYEEVDAGGMVFPIPLNGNVEFIANYDRECQLQRVVNIWALIDNQSGDSEAIMDPEDGSVYVYGTADFPMTMSDGGTLGLGLSASYFYLIKFNQNLDRQWVYQFGFDMAQSGTSPYFHKTQVHPGVDGGVLITGSYGQESSPLISGNSLPPYTDGYGTFAVKLDGNAQTRWVKDGLLKDFGFASRIFKAFPMSNGDFVLAGNTNTGYYKLGDVEFNFVDPTMSNQFVFRIDAAGNPVWSRPFESRGRVEEGKKKGASSEVLDGNIFYDALSWKNRILYLTAPFANPGFTVAGRAMPLNYARGIYVAALDMRDGTELWGYALSSDDSEIYGFDVDRAGNVSLMGYNNTTQNLDGVPETPLVPGNVLFHLGLDYNGKPLWRNNVNLLNPPYNDIRGVDLEVLPNGQVFSSMNMTTTNDIQVGGEVVGEGEIAYSSWIMELASDIRLGGKVTDANDDPVYPGYVRAIKSTWWGMYPTVDSAFLAEDGTFLFDQLYPGNYVLLAVPDRDKYPNDVCTYFGDQTGWLEASAYDIAPAFSTSSVNIKLLEVSPLSAGSGSLSGTISLDSDVEDARKGTNARPSPKSSVILIKKGKKSTMAGEIIAYVETDDFGIFTFVNVPDGDYFLHVEVAGLEMLQIHDVTIAGNQIISGLDYTVSEEGIYTGWPVGISLLENEELLIYPNPGPGLLLMDLPAAGEYVVKVYAIDGRLVLQDQFTSAGGARSINISEASDGNYFIRVVGPETDETLKYIKQ